MLYYVVFGHLLRKVFARLSSITGLSESRSIGNKFIQWLIIIIDFNRQQNMSICLGQNTRKLFYPDRVSIKFRTQSLKFGWTILKREPNLCSRKAALLLLTSNDLRFWKFHTFRPQTTNEVQFLCLCHDFKPARLISNQEPTSFTARWWEISFYRNKPDKNQRLAMSHDKHYLSCQVQYEKDIKQVFSYRDKTSISLWFSNYIDKESTPHNKQETKYV